ncbi:MAG: hypothetical protein LBG44_11675 [Gemmatimonadota bacterium]|nr:hypothetical protein [Gemmatimonadota bacterium]
MNRRRILMSLGVAFILATTTTCRSTPIHAQHPIPAEVESRILSALHTRPDQPIQIRIYADSELFPGLTFMQGQRVPPFGDGMEDGRPGKATVIASQNDTVLVTRITDLPVVWKLLHNHPSQTTRTDLDRILKLLEFTGQITPEQILQGPQDAARWKSLYRDTTKISDVRPPSEMHLPDRVIVSVFADGFLGIVRYDFVVNDDELTINDELVAELIVHM